MVLLTFAAHATFAKASSPSGRRRALASVLYGALFIVAAFILWYRKEVTSPVVPKPSPPQTETRSPVSPAPAKIDSIPSLPPESPVTFNEEPQPPELKVWQPVEPVPQAPHARRRLPANAPDDPLYAAVDRAFTAIEAFFNRYGSPAPSSDMRRVVLRHVALNSAEVQFPHIAFGEGSAEISPESISALKTLAVDLKRRPELNIEIQTRVDSLGSEAYNLMLTQARASAVKDWLVVEGVPAERLIARGFGTRPLPAGSGSPIAFVVRH